jgi:hypothetical protein
MRVFAMKVLHIDRFAGRKLSAGRLLSALTVGMTLTALISPSVISSSAWAQLSMPGGNPGDVATGRGHVGAAPVKPSLPPPEAIPGAKAREPAAPNTHISGDMEPTEALFDAINRGDIASARDAINRGADMNGVNILGMTPMELSVDLGRNDISFLLLSNRGEDSGRGSRAVGRDALATAPAHIPAGRAAQMGNRPGAAGKPVPGKAAQPANTPVAAKPVATPKLFANDGGTPLPSAGFLGFDSRSAAN